MLYLLIRLTFQSLYPGNCFHLVVRNSNCKILVFGGVRIEFKTKSSVFTKIGGSLYFSVLLFKSKAEIKFLH
jgi:hypothetical protein